MKILHTSDWHLGQKFISREREEEHILALNWLAEIIVQQEIEVLIIAGDIFDIGNPPSSSRSLYYNFLKLLWQTKCRHIVVIGGNHDSPQMLEAPKEILSILNVHLVGKAAEDPSEQIIRLTDEKGHLQLVVAAVPFLRDQDLRRVVSNNSSNDRIERIREGILNHYQNISEACLNEDFAKVPVIATGHLCVTGHKSSEKQDNIYLGSLENISADQFPSVFDYVALGHIHRPQAIAPFEKIRYSGSLIPLSFSETKDEKSVTLIEFQGKNISNIEEIKVPIFRRLKSISGTFEYVQERLEKLHHDYQDGLTVWVEVIVESDSIIPNLNGILQEFVKDFNVEILKTRAKYNFQTLSEQLEHQELDELEPIDVFKKKCESGGRPAKDTEELLTTFKELEEWVREKEK